MQGNLLYSSRTSRYDSLQLPPVFHARVLPLLCRYRDGGNPVCRHPPRYAASRQFFRASRGRYLPRLLISPAGLALFILLVPFFLVWPWWFRHGILDRIMLIMQLIVGILMIAAGWLSFSRAGLAARVLSGHIPVTLYLPFGIFELSAFVLAGTTAFITIDALQRYLLNSGNLPEFRPSDIGWFLFSRVWKTGLLILALLFIAAVTEYGVPPWLVTAVFTGG